jgi:hypothetical protein
MLEKIVSTGLKVDFHIHSYASKHRESDDCVDLSTIDNLNKLIEQLNNRKINMCSISDHDNFDMEIYKKLKKEEKKGSIKKVFPAVEFSVVYEKKVLHIITIFDDSDEEKISKIHSYLFDDNLNCAKYDNVDLKAFSESKYLEILKDIGLNVVMIAHQKETLSSCQSRTHDVKDLGDEKFDELVFLDYFESFEFKSKKNEIFNKYYIEKNREKYKEASLRFITGSDCHDWNKYPEEDDDFQFTYLKCIPSFRGLAMAVTNTKRINYVNNFFTTSDSVLNSINININEKEYNVELSKGINVIIGDNSIGKSLLIHKLTNYEYISDSKLKDSYEDYLKAKKIIISTSLQKKDISRFDGQGSIRKMFEDKSFDSNSFLNSFFPVPPLVNKYIETYKTEIDNYISVLINKEELRLSKNKLGSIKITIIDSVSKTINLKKIPQTVILGINSKIKKIGKIVENFESVNNLFKQILENEFFADEDKEYINNVIENNSKYIKKYNNIIDDNKNEIAKINIINNVFENKSIEYSKTMTDETEKISNYENNKDSFANSIVDYYIKSQKEIICSPNIQKEAIPVSKETVGKYRFVIKTNTKEISSEDFVSMIKRVLGKSYKDINLIDYQNIPEKFGNRGKETTYIEKINNMKQELYAEITKCFEPVKTINDASDKDVTKVLSAGFNSKIYFDLISNCIEDKKIYIIDQPEDDVSQPAIKSNLLKDFSDMSKNKQIIIITHNPQFIVNLDVDNVIFMGKDENDNIYIQNGALEYFNDEYDILKIVADNIEGGVESINERWKRYDKNIYNI